MAKTYLQVGNLKGPKGDGSEIYIEEDMSGDQHVNICFMRNFNASGKDRPILVYDSQSFHKYGNDDEKLCLNAATEGALGGVKVGEGLTIDGNGTLSVTNPLNFATKTYADCVAYGSRLLQPLDFDFKQIESSPYSPTCMPTCHVNTDESTRYRYPYKVKLDKVSTDPFAACLMLPPTKQITNIQVQIEAGTHLTIPDGTKIAVKIYGIDPTTLQPVEGVSYEEDFDFVRNELGKELRATITKSEYVNLFPSAISVSFKTTDGIVLKDATADYDMLLNLFSKSLECGFLNFTMTLTKDVTVPAKKTYQTNDFSIEADNAFISVVPIDFYQPIGIVDIDVEKKTVLRFNNKSLAISNFSDVPVTLNAGTKKKVVLYGPTQPFDTSLE